MASTIKTLVSRKKKRYKEDGFNLDLTYIFENVIAMGYPAAQLEGVYRNHINDVYKFLETKHKDHYKIYNLCSERSYDGRRFHDRVSVFPFDDHNPPKLELIQPFCLDVDEWLNQDPLNVAVVHCKAGKGRTGVMICCYILHRGWSENADEALKHYGQTRTHDTKGVTIPSQRRYVDYYDQLLKSSGVEYSSCPLVLHEVRLEPVPNMSGGCVPVLTVFEAESQVQLTPTVELSKVGRVLRLTLNPPLILKGDVRITLKNKPNVMMIKEKMFHFWFNTFFVRDQVLLPSPSTPPPLTIPFSINSSVPSTDADSKTDGVSAEQNSNTASTISLTKADGLAFKSRWGASFSDRTDRSGSCPNNQLAPNTLWPGSRASSLNSVYSENSNTTNTSEPLQWLSLTLTKRELDKICKDNHHKVYTSDFKVTMFFTKPGQGGHNGVGSLPNMETVSNISRSSVAVVTGLTPSGGLPSRFASSPAFNGSSRPKSNIPTGSVQQQPKLSQKKVSSLKPSSPNNLGLLGPICWRSVPVSAGDYVEKCGGGEVVDAENRPAIHHSDSSQTWSSEDSSEVEGTDRTPPNEKVSINNDEDEADPGESTYL